MYLHTYLYVCAVGMLLFLNCANMQIQYKYDAILYCSQSISA